MKLTKYRIKEEYYHGFGTRYYLQFLDCWRLFFFISTPIKVWRYVPDDFKRNIFKKWECASIISRNPIHFSRTSCYKVISFKYAQTSNEFAKENPFIEMYLKGLMHKNNVDKESKIQYL